jgi:23S rRNA (uracil1939-C5)-methyltransferase
VHGGEALARHEGRVVFVRGAAPGDLVEAEVTGAGSFEHARALRVLERGPSRVDAPCPIVERCGGCPVQQVAVADQLAAKQALTADALERIGGFPRGSYELAPIIPSPLAFRYRRRARLHRTGARWGFAQRGSALVAPVDECLLFEPALQALADAVRAAGDLPGVTDLGLLVLASGKGAIDLRAAKITPALRARAEKLLSSVRAGPASLRGLTLSGDRPASGPAPAPEVLGDPVLVDPPLENGARLRSRPDLFAQANRAAVPLLQAEALRAVGPAQRVLELFCGSGTLTLPLLGAGREVTAVEFEGPSLGLLRKSADEAGLPVKLIAGDAAKVARGWQDPVDCVLLDPPRTGAAAVVQALAKLQVARIVYVSCDAPTLARDARLLAAAGYRLLRAVALDLFPQTAHFEVIATFTR